MTLASLKFFALSSVFVAACADTGGSDQGVTGAPASRYEVTPLVTNKTDPDLVNPWGLVGSDGLFWIADNGTGKVSVYDGVGRTSDEYPTGHFSLGEGITGVAHMFGEGEVSHSFLVSTGEGTDCTPAEFVFASEDGKLIGINDDTPASGVVAATTQGANYKGVTKIQTGHGPALLAADFVGAKVDMFDSKWKPMTSPFVDPQMPAGWGPFNVLALGDRVYVEYAKIGSDGDEQAGPGLGRVSVFDFAGNIVGRIASDSFNAPWGVAVIDRTLYIGNFGDGHINAFDVNTFDPLGPIADATGTPIALEGLWGLVAGSDDAGAEGSLYFAQGPEEESAGVYGRIDHR